MVAFECFTGKRPFEGDTAAIMYKQINEPPPKPSSLLARLEGPLEPVLLKVLEKAPPHRLASGAAFAGALTTAYENLKSEDLDQRIQRTEVLLTSGQTQAAITERELLPGLYPDNKRVILNPDAHAHLAAAKSAKWRS